MDLISANTEIKATPKYVIKETNKSLESKFPGFILYCIDIIKCLNEIFDGVIKGVTFDSIDICYGLPKKKVGF